MSRSGRVRLVSRNVVEMDLEASCDERRKRKGVIVDGEARQERSDGKELARSGLSGQHKR